MELWIRSQDKQILAKIEYVYLEVNEGREILGGNNYMINKWLGTYATKERALEVLDEIQKAILVSGANYEDIKEIKKEFKSWVATNTKTGVVIYEMPED